jgi:hypothetical protein
MLLIFVLENANQEILAVVEVVIALTLVALGTDVSALAVALPTNSAAMTARAAKRSFKVCLSSDELECRSHPVWSNGCNPPAWFWCLC